jgi:hypothetical protein
MQWRAVADQIRQKVPKLAAIMDEAEHDVLAYMTFPREHRTKLHSTDEMDKRIRVSGGILGMRRRPRGEARRIGCKRRRAAQGCPAGLRRLRTAHGQGRPRGAFGAAQRAALGVCLPYAGAERQRALGR